MMRAFAVLILGAAAAMAACGSGKHNDNKDAGTVSDAAPAIDGGGTVYDAMPDATVGPTAAPPGTQLDSAGNRLQGGSFTLDVQLGAPVSQQPTSGNGKTFEGNSPIKP